MHNEFDPLKDIDISKEIEVVTAPIEEPVVKVISATTPYIDPITTADINKVAKDFITQPLPNEYVSDKDMSADLSNEEERLTSKKNITKEDVANLEDMGSSYAAINWGFYEKGEFNDPMNISPNSYVQYVVGDKGKNIRIGYPSYTVKDDVETLEGASAMRFLSKLVAVSNPTIIPLWHSGIILELNVFKEQEMLDLNLKLARQKVITGNNTRGASFTGDDVHVVNTILGFILDHVTDSNLKNFTIAKLRKLIRVTDNPAILCGSLAGIYPGGYPIAHSCKNRAKGCDFNILAKKKDNGDYLPEGLLDFNKLLWVDKDKLPSAAKSFMSDINIKRTAEEILDYQSNLYAYTDNVGIEVWKKNNVTITAFFKVPTLTEYAVSGNDWVSRITTMVDKAIALDNDLDADERKAKRTELLTSYATVMDLLKHDSWVDYFRIDNEDGQKIISNSTAIKESLEIFAGIEGFKDDFDVAVQMFKESIIVAWTGLPNFECPVCHSGQIQPGSPHPTLIPINMVGYFFITMVRRGMIRHQIG